jgi:alpha-beta hydrolase superfamily lysophospholipase
MDSSDLSIISSDSLKLHVAHWRPDSSGSGTGASIKGVICLVHGLGDHTGLYTHVGEFFTMSGFAVLAMDLRGHGKSGGKRGHMPSFDIVLEDLDRLADKAESLYPGLPVFIYGHSFGGNLALNYALRYSKRPSISGVISTSPWLRLAFEPPASKLFLAKIANRLYPGFTQNNSLVLSDLSHDPSHSEKYASDPLTHSFITARFFYNACSAGSWAIDHAERLSLPLLLMHGSGDHITSSGASAEFARRAGRYCTFRLWDGLFHELHNEYQKQEILDYILQWISGLI